MVSRWLGLFACGVAGLGWMACSSESETGTPIAPSGVGGSGGDASASSAGGAGQGGDGAGMVDPCADVMCGDGEVCDDGQCVMGCNVDADCGPGLTCCSDICVDVSSDLDDCGTCGNSCDQPPNVAASCDMGVCQLGACLMGFFDCDGDSSNGCESDAECSCTPGEVQNCYPGPANTQGVGECVTGTRKCNDAGTAFSLCSGFVLPSPEICANNADEDCNGMDDDVPDLDGDGWTRCDNDCCETMQDCADPALVNPGAFEAVGNMVDDDCDPGTSDATAPPACSTSQKFGSISADELAEAMDICQTTTANPPLSNRKWGLISAEFRRANGTNPSGAELNEIRNCQTAVMTAFGTGGVVPQLGPTMAGLSSGWMRDANDPNAPAQPSTNFSNASQPPASYLSANGGNLPSSSSCFGTCPAGTGANDSVNLRLQLRVPTNAQSFAYQFRFFSWEYWDWSCSVYNDFYLALLGSSATGLPADGNISFDANGNPVSVNNSFFQVCAPMGCSMCPSGTGALAGTGFDVGAPDGGATEWLQTTAPVVPGETMTLELMIFDVSDNVLDSAVLLDSFEWSVMSSGVGTGPPG